MSSEYEWMRLPGLFRWDEVCDVFATEALPDHEWRFHVQLAPPSSTRSDALYVVHASSTRVRPFTRRHKVGARDARETPAGDPPR